MAQHVWLVALATLLPAQAGDAPGFSWERYVAKKGGFSVKLPNQPQEQDKTFTTPRGPVDIHVMSYADEDITYMAYVQDAPGVTQALREPYLDNRRDEIIRAKRGRLVDQTRMTMAGRHAGREVIVNFKPVPNAPAVTEKIRMYLVGERLYEIYAQTKAGPREDPRVDAFLDSFQLEEGRPGATSTRAAGEPRPAWKTISPAGEGFSVALPGTPRKGETAPAGAGELPTVQYQAASGPISYSVSYVDYPAAAVRDPKRLLDGTLAAAVRLSKGELRREGRITLGRYPGREFEAEIPLVKPKATKSEGAAEAREDKPAEAKDKDDEPGGKGLLRCRIYLVRRRVYQVMAAGPKEEMGAEQVADFFKSFKLVAR
jgi:hypothetical protein